jgi:hypothetical protein
MNRGTVEDANFYSDKETADVGLDIDENLLREEDLEVFNTNSEFDQQSNADLDAESMDDEHTLPLSVRLQSPSPVQPGTTHTPLVSAITDNVELVHDGSDTSDTAPTDRLSGQIAHPSRSDELPVNKPVIPAAVQTESSMEAWEQCVRKSCTLYLNACICGSEVSEVEINKGDTVMRCKVLGCETQWVHKNFISTFYFAY